MLRNQYEVGHDEVLGSVHRHRCFGWSWCQYQEEPFRHTAILLYFDYKPKFTINFKPHDRSSKFGALFDSAASKVVAEKIIPGVDAKFHPPFEEIMIFTQEHKNTVTKRLRFFLEAFSDESYNLVVNNCRSHVRHVVYQARDKWRIQITSKFKQYAESEDEPHDFNKEMKKVIEGDDLRYAGAGIGAVVGTAVVVGLGKLVYDWAIGENQQQEEDKEKKVKRHHHNQWQHMA